MTNTNRTTANRKDRWGSYSISINFNRNEPLLDFHIANIRWLGIWRLILGKLSVNVTYPINLDLGD